MTQVQFTIQAFIQKRSMPITRYNAAKSPTLQAMNLARNFMNADWLAECHLRRL